MQMSKYKFKFYFYFSDKYNIYILVPFVYKVKPIKSESNINERNLN